MQSFKRKYLLLLVAILELHQSTSSSCITAAAFVATATAKARVVNHYGRNVISRISKPTSCVKVQIEGEEGQEKTRRRKKPCRWVACRTTKDLTEACRQYLKPGMVVAELGAQLRDTSHQICTSIGPQGTALLCDVARKAPSGKDAARTSAMRQPEDDHSFPFLSDRAVFCQLTNWDAWRHTLFSKNWQSQLKSQRDKMAQVIGGDTTTGTTKHKFDALVVDMTATGGNDLELTSLTLLKEFLAWNNNSMDEDCDEADGGECQVILVKSSSLHSLARRLVHGQRILDGSTNVHLDSKRSSGSGKDPWLVATVGVQEYRRTIPYAIRPKDTVLEVGCHLGTTTALLYEEVTVDEATDGGSCIGVDISRSIVEGAEKRHSHVTFAVGSAWDTALLLRLKQQHFSQYKTWGYDVVYVDVGGLSGANGLLEALALLNALGQALEPRCIVIKSLCMQRLASSLVPFSTNWKQTP
eukprot:scaffold8275_cov54-Attheya_sp.AAC.1